MALQTLRKWASRSSLSLRGGPTPPEMEVDEAEPPQKEAIHLPAELILEILSYLPLTRPSTQHTLFNVCLVSNEWYQVAIARLYYQPYITGRNFDFFVRTLCPSVNAHVRKSDLAGLVHVLDLSRLVHHSTKSTTARLLGRTKPKLMWFKAPATSFGLNCFAALSKCRELRILDLSLVNDAISMHSLAQSLKSLPELQRLSLPRSSPRVEDFQASNFVFPRYLDVLTLQGGISDAFVKDLAEPLLRLGINDLTLNICHCPQVSSVGISDLIRPTQQMLHTLHISNLPSLGRGRFRSLLNFVLQECPLTELSVSSDYVSWELVWHNELFRRLLDPAYLDDPYDNSTARDPRRLAFDKWKTLQDKAIIGRYEAHPLKVLEITSSGDPIMEPDEMIRPGEILFSMESGYLANLRHVAVSNSCGWDRPEFVYEWKKLGDRISALAGNETTFITKGTNEVDVGMYSFDD